MKLHELIFNRAATVAIMSVFVLAAGSGIVCHDRAAAAEMEIAPVGESTLAEDDIAKQFYEDVAAEEQYQKTMAAKVTIEPSLNWRAANRTSRVNPGNSAYIDGRFFSTESFISVNDFFDASKEFRWWLKSYSLYTLEKNGAGDRLSDARLDEAFFDLHEQNYFASIGKRRMYWGNALFFSAVNVIVPQRDPLDPSRATEGFPLGWVGYSNDHMSLDLIATRDFDEYWDSELNRWGAKIGVSGLQYDYAFYYFDGERYKDNLKYETMIGASGSMKALSGMSLYGEIAAFMHNNRNYYGSSGMAERKNSSYTKAIVGTNIIIDPESFLSFSRGDASANLEFYYNQAGYSKNELANYYNAISSSSSSDLPEILSDYKILEMNRLYSLVSYSNNFRERYTTTATAIVADDLSLSSLVAAEYNLSDYYTFRLSWAHTCGNRQSEFGNSPVTDAVQFRTSIYF